MVAQGDARERQHHQHEVGAHRPQRDDGRDAEDARALEHGAAEPRRGGGGAVLDADGDGVLARLQPRCGRRDHVDLVRGEVGLGEAGGVVHHGAAGGAGGGVRVVGEHEEPGDGEDGGVEGVDDRVDGVEVGEREAAEGVLRADAGEEEERDGERGDRVHVHAQLHARELVARKEREDAIHPGDFVDEERGRDELGAGPEGHEV